MELPPTLWKKDSTHTHAARDRLKDLSKPPIDQQPIFKWKKKEHADKRKHARDLFRKSCSVFSSKQFPLPTPLFSPPLILLPV